MFGKYILYLEWDERVGYFIFNRHKTGGFFKINNKQLILK